MNDASRVLADHDKAVADHENRLRALEKWTSRVAGGLVLLSLEIPLFAGLVVLYFQWLLKKP